MTNAKFEIKENLLTLESKGEFHKEINLISWLGREATYDLRGWNEDKTKMTKGATLTKAELEQLIEKMGGIKL